MSCFSFIYYSYEGLNSFYGKYNWVSGKRWTDLFVMEKLGKGESHVFNNIMALKGKEKMADDVLSLWWKVALNKRYLVRHDSDF